jgi:hypothetical protein
MYVDLTEGERYQNEQGSARSFSTPVKRITLIRSMATIISLIFTLTVLKRYIPLDHIGTRPLENFFGLLRKLLQGCNKFSEFLHAAARSVIVTVIIDELRRPRDMGGRENLGGVVSQTEGRTFEDPQYTPKEAEKHIWTTRRSVERGICPICSRGRSD